MALGEMATQQKTLLRLTFNTPGVLLCPKEKEMELILEELEEMEMEMEMEDCQEEVFPLTPEVRAAVVAEQETFDES